MEEGDEQVIARARERFGKCAVLEDTFRQQCADDLAIFGPKIVQVEFWERLWLKLTFRTPHKLDWSWSR